MTRLEALKAIANIYNTDISKYQLKNVGQIFKTKNKNEMINKIFNIYNLLIFNLYQNNMRLKDIKKIHLINNTIYFDLEFLKNYELCDKEV